MKFLPACSLFIVVVIAVPVQGFVGGVVPTNIIHTGTGDILKHRARFSPPRVRLFSVKVDDNAPSTNGVVEAVVGVVPQTTTSTSNEAVVSTTAVVELPQENNQNSALQVQQGTSSSLDLWKRRLITHEDPFSLHKLASAGYTLSAATLLATAAWQRLGQHEFAEIPPVLEPVMWTFTCSNLVMCLASMRMAFIHRQGDLTARNAFLGTAVSSLFSGFFMVWISPFDSPVVGLLENDIINRSCFAVLVILNVYLIMDTILNTNEIVEGRRDRKAQDYAGRTIVDTLGYVFPVAWGMPLIVSTGYIASVWHDRPWFMEQCLFIDHGMGVAEGSMQAHIFYQQLSTSLAASYASLFVTLRDKKLINKTQELTGITAFALPSLIWSAYTTYYFTSYLFVPH